jgi:hypothetical protein
LIGQLVAKRGIGDRDQGFGALVDRFVAKMRDAVLGDHDVGVGAGAADHVSVAEPHNDAGGLAAAGGRRQREDRPTTSGQTRTAHEIDQPTGAADLTTPEHLGVGLAEQIHGEHRVDRDEAVDPRDHPHVVGMAHRGEAQIGAPARPVVDPRAAEGGGRDHDPPVVGLLRTGQDARLVQIGDLVAHHAAVQAEVPPVVECREHRRGHLADADLDRIAVLDQAGDVLTDPMDLRRQVTGRQRDQRALGLDHVAQAFVRDLEALRRPRRGGVDLGDDLLGAVEHRRHEVH